MGGFLARSLVVLSLMLALQTPALAEGPLHVRDQIDFTFRSPGASAICGFDVLVHVEGVGQAALFYDRNGNIVRENDSAPDLKMTIFAPSNGNSWTFALSAALHTLYTDGGAIGSTGTAVLTGVAQRFPGAGIDAGRTVFETLVVDVTPEGLPVTDFTNVLSHSGPLLDMSLAAARCDAVR